LNILRITTLFVPPWKGLGPGPYELSKAQTDLNNRVIVLTKYVNKCNDFDENQNFKIYRIKCKFDLTFSFVAFFYSIFLIKKYKIDVLHSHGYSAFFNILFKKFLGIEIVSSVHILRASQNIKLDFLKDRFSDLLDFKYEHNFVESILEKLSLLKSQLFEKFYIKYSDVLVTVSSEIKNDILKFYHRSNKVHVIYNGVNIEIFKKVNNNFKFDKIPNESIKLIFVGGLNGRKGEFDLLSAFSSLVQKHKKKLFLIIVGDGPTLNLFSKKIDENKLVEQVFIIKNLNHSDLVNYLNFSDIFVFPSYSEGLPKVLIEAMLSNLIVLASDISPHKDLISDEDDGFLFKTGDINQLQKKLNYIVENYDKLEDIKKNARLKILKKYQWKNVAIRLQTIYKKYI
jgi:glycosyltransferase involved in cell wall biosynthesis